MNTKLTLSIEKNLTVKAKVYAKSQGRSLSDLVENIFQLLTDENIGIDLPVSSRIESLRGVLKISEEHS